MITVPKSLRDSREKNVPKPRPLILQHSNTNRLPSMPFNFQNRSHAAKTPSFSWNKTLDSSLLELYGRFGPQWQLICQLLPPSAIKSNRGMLTSEAVRKRFKDLQSKRIAKQVFEFNLLQAQQDYKPILPKPQMLEQEDKLKNENQFEKYAQNNCENSIPMPNVHIKPEPLDTSSELESPKEDFHELEADSSYSNTVNVSLSSSPQADEYFDSMNKFCPISSSQNSTISNCMNHQLAQPLEELDFMVQTPTKTLAESERLSFHLVSPPIFTKDHHNSITNDEFYDLTTSPLMSWGRVKLKRPAAVNVSCPTMHKRSRVQAPPCGRLFPSIEQTNKTPEGVRSKISIPKPSTTVKLTIQTNEDIEKSEFKEISSSNEDHFDENTSSLNNRGLNEQNWENADMIALNTAKATVMNRLIMQEREKELKQRFEARLARRQMFNLTSQALAPGENTIPRLSVSASLQPHHELRRVLQIENDENWRYYAFGDNRACDSMLQLARDFFSPSPARDEEVLDVSVKPIDNLCDIKPPPFPSSANVSKSIKR